MACIEARTIAHTHITLAAASALILEQQLTTCCHCVYTYIPIQVYIEAYHSVPKGTCRRLVKTMAWLFFGAWTAFPILFITGPEGVGYMSVYGSLICHAIADLLSKNLWGLCGHELRIKVGWGWVWTQLSLY